MVLDRFRADQDHQRRTSAFVDVLMQEPEAEDVDWLAGVATRGDRDHAQWELRYARRAAGLLAAQRDALDDRTASSVARELTGRVQRDRAIDPAKRDLADAQFNARLSAYRDGLEMRSTVPLERRLGQTLFAFAGGSFRDSDENMRRAGALITGYLADANRALRTHFGVAALPEDVPPSALGTRR
jgi:hypothetical protein